MDIQPGFFLGVQVGQLCPDGHYVGEVQTVVVLWVPDPPDIYLDGYKLILTKQQVVQKVHHMASSTMSPNWQLESAQNL